MDNLQTVKDAIKSLLIELEAQNYSSSTLKNYKGRLNGLVKFMEMQNISILSNEVGLAYIEQKTKIKMEGFYGKGNNYVNTYIKPIQRLIVFMETGKNACIVRSKLPKYIPPKCFEEEYDLFQEVFEERNYAKSTITSHNQILQKFLNHLKEEGVSESRKIQQKNIKSFMQKYEKCKPKYISTILYVLRNYLSFIYQEKFTPNNLSPNLPRVRIMRNAFIPYSWDTEDVKKLLNAVDRSDPKGKRDYAILLLIVHLGLRVSDIRKLAFSNLNWDRKTIEFTMQKTKQSIELPILDDIGWAIIDYLKDGRPNSKSDRVFIRHKAPYDAFGENESFYKELHRYMIKAGLKIPIDLHCGMHSLRSTLARNMLEAKTPLPIISETLGHQNINTTSIYLKIDINGLKKCAINPEEVFA